jgi:hypothetical protein
MKDTETFIKSHWKLSHPANVRDKTKTVRTMLKIWAVIYILRRKRCFYLDLATSTP